MALIEQTDEAGTLDLTVNDLGHELRKATDFCEETYAASRARAQRYYNGESDLPVDANRSSYVATKVRDIIRQVKPSLMRTMVSTQYPVQFVPSTVAQSMIADAQTKFVSQLFYDLGGYKTIYDAFHSAMLFKLGVVKYYYQKSDKQTFRKYTGLNEMQVQMLTGHPMVEIVSGEETQIPGPQGMTRIFDVEVVGTMPAGEIQMKWVSLDDFVVDRNATCLEDARVVAHRRDVTKSDCIEMGFDPELLDGLNSDNPESNSFSALSFARRGYTVDNSYRHTSDESQDVVLLTEAYYKVDMDGTGVAQQYRFWLGGTHYELLDYERVDDIPFAMFSIDPEPGTLFGKSLYDLVNGDADVLTSLTRASVDNFHMTNNPSLVVTEGMVTDMDDVLNNEIGRVIRTRAAGQIQPLTIPFTGGQALPMLNMISTGVENKTGVTAAASGLDPDALQSTNSDAVKNTIQLAQGQVELMARNLAETGLVTLFKGLLKLAMTHLDTNQILRTPDGAQPVPLNMFDPAMASVVRVGTGTGNYDERMAMYEKIGAKQEQILAQLGPGNPVVSMQQIQNTMDDSMAMIGMYNPRRYFSQVTPQMEQQLAQQKQQNDQRKEQASMQIAQQQAGALAQAETIKGEVKMQTDAAKNQLELLKMHQAGMIDSAQLEQKSQSEFTNLMVKDDLARDQMLQTLMLELKKLQVSFAETVAQLNNAQRMN